MSIGVTHLLRRADGRTFRVTGAWNDVKPVAQERFEMIVAGAIQLPR